MLARSATGENDLDLLVDRRSAQRFLAVLARLGFRQAVAPGGREHPGVSHHYVLDVESGRLVHIHAHFVLVVGDDTTKNFPARRSRTPTWPRCAATTTSCRPLPDFELGVLVVRMMLKHAT